MRANRTGLVLVPAIAAAALGQGTMTFYWITDDTGDRDGVIEPGESAVLRLWAYMDPRPVMIAGANYDIAGDSGWRSRGSVDRYESLLDELGVGPGELHDDNSIIGIENFQLPPFFGGYRAENPINLYKIVWTPTDYGAWEISVWTQNHTTARVYTDQFGTSVDYEVVVERGTFQIAPAPGSLTLLVGAGWGALRRWR